MKSLGRILTFFCLGMLVITSGPAGPYAEGGDDPAQGPASFRGRSVGISGLFIENRGQSAEGIRYLLRGRDFGISCLDDGLIFHLPLRKKADDPFPSSVSNIRAAFPGANPEVRVRGLESSPGKVNFLSTPNENTWVRGAETFRTLVYEDIYKGIDLVLAAGRGKVKSEYHVDPGADPSVIRIRFDGQDDVAFGSSGDLVISAGDLELREEPPFSFQPSEGKQVPVSSGYVLHADGSVGFRVGDYDRRLPLIIDPALLYGTYIGGGGNEEPKAFVLDGAGCAYITGSTTSADFPTTAGSFDVSHNGGSTDVFVAKLNASGMDLVYATFIGGSGAEEGNGIAVDEGGSAYLTGQTSSADFPTTEGAYDTVLGGIGDAFVLKLNPAGSDLTWSTYLGGTAAASFDDGRAIALDGTGAVYVGGIAGSDDFPTTVGAYDTVKNGIACGFITKINATGSGLVSSTFLDGGSQDSVYDIKVNDEGNVYAAGWTNSTNFPVSVSAPQDTYGGSGDGFLSKLNSALSGLEYSTFIGGSGNDWVNAIALIEAGDVFAIGSSASADFPVSAGAYDKTFGGVFDVFAARLNAAGTAFSYATYLGGSGDDRGNSVIQFGEENTILVGTTLSGDFPDLAGAVDTLTYREAFMASFNATGSSLNFSSFLGGNRDDYGIGLAMSSFAGYILIKTESTDFDAPSYSYDPTFNGGTDAALVAFGLAERDDLLGTWSGQGVYCLDVSEDDWVKLASPALQVACGDLDCDGYDDLIGEWAGQSVWFKCSESGAWVKLSSTAAHIAAGDMNGDGKCDFLGTWDGQGVYYCDNETHGWIKMATPATMVAAGDLDDDGCCDLIGIWPGQGGVWVKYSATGTWARLSSTADWIGCGDMNGDGRDDFLGTWAGQGVYYRDSAGGAWVKMASPASQIAAGDLDGDRTDDLAGIWPGQGGVWAKGSFTGLWFPVSSTADWIACGKMTPDNGEDEAVALMRSLGLMAAEGPPAGSGFRDLSAGAPGGSRFQFESQRLLVPVSGSKAFEPGPGDPGFRCFEQQNLIPRQQLKREPPKMKQPRSHKK
jgi:hypothetical protein